MPVNSITEPKKSIAKSKFTLSLNRNNANYLSSKRSEVIEELNKSNPCKSNNNGNKENKPLKRPFSNTFTNTLNAAKKLKPLTELSKPSVKVIESELIITESPLKSAMLNGHHPTDNQYGGSTQKKTPIATLSNLGNTCFLNSVLYTLRYAPRFLHNLHHLVSDLASVEQKLGSIRLKSSSLGRTAAGLAASGARSWSSKDLLSLGQSDSNTGKSKIQIATEKLHETYFNLKAAENKCLNSNSADATPEPYAPEAFLAALRDVNSTFEGNRQQDAHELLVCILDNIRETCRALSARAAPLQIHENGESNGINRQTNPENESSKPTLGNLRKSWKKRKEAKTGERRNSPTEDRPASPVKDEGQKPGWDFVAEDFEGTMVVRTMCVECEFVREKSQALCEVCVPIGDEELCSNEPFKAAALTTEYLRDQNKYWCGRCLRYNEARRSVAFSRLPHLLVLQLKRFSGGMEKITRHAPTPLEMSCFCERCVGSTGPTPHTYTLCCVIMHLGQALSGGHYVCYTRPAPAAAAAPTNAAPGPPAAPAPAPCARSDPAASSSFMKSLFSRGRAPTGCPAAHCCVPTAAGTGWLACDDDLVKPITDQEFQALLEDRPNIQTKATPYLLFYVKSDN